MHKFGGKFVHFFIYFFTKMMYYRGVTIIYNMLGGFRFGKNNQQEKASWIPGIPLHTAVFGFSSIIFLLSAVWLGICLF